MKHRISDLLLLLVIFAFPVFGILQSCNDGGGVAPDGNLAPVPVVKTSVDTVGTSPLTVEFDASGSYDPEHDTIEYLWHFSDGTSTPGEKVSHTFVGSGRHSAILVVSDRWKNTAESEPQFVYILGLANSPWPKFAHDVRNSGVSPNPGPMMDLENADSGGAFPRHWTSGLTDAPIAGIVVGYDGVIFYTQANRLHARKSDGGYVWDYIVNSEIITWPAVLYDGSVVFATLNGIIYRISSNRELIWKFNFGEKYFFGPTITASEDGIIAPFRFEKTQIHDEGGSLNCLGFDGILKWSFPIEDVRGTMSISTGIYPAILPNGNIVINGEAPTILSPDGSVVSEFSYQKPDKAYVEYLGVPVINSDGLIAFTHPDLPIFDASGNLVKAVFELEPVSVNYGIPGVWDDDFLTLPTYFTYDDDNGDSVTDFLLYTVLQDGGFDEFISKSQPKVFEPSECVFGACEDVNGRIYVSNFGLHSVSPPYVEAGLPRRYSLWSYTRESWEMTAPVIGEDGWLYLGYGNDIMALGD